MQFSLEPLEFPRLKELLRTYVNSETGRRVLDEIQPTTNLERLQAQHALNGEAMEYLRERQVSFAEISRLDHVLDQLDVAGSTLSLSEVEAIQSFLVEIQSFRGRWVREEGFPRLAAKALRLPDLKELRSVLGRAVRDGQVSEDYSPELKRLRRGLEKARAGLQRKLERILRSSESQGQLQDDLVTLRNGRFVIPVRADQKRAVAGIVHGSSSSGATVFMEPLETLEMNNELVRLEEEVEREVQRILGELTERIRETRETLVEAASLWFEMEVLFGIARFGRDFDCVGPSFSEGDFRIANARHPLLESRLRNTGDAVIGLTFETDKQERLVVISGPNAGGKTLVLKTVGLLTLMAQSGLPVPADRAVFPLADRVLADIGDQQSIADQLSTFSAHVLEISAMVEAATRDSLILLDEIGSSTEPGEGAALGVAVLEHFRSAGSRAIATTHYNRLKMYAEMTPGVRNASMEFDETTLEPTYRLLDGLAGQSSGLKMAERFGLPRALIEAARESLDQRDIEAARYVEELRSRIEALEEEKRRLEEARRDFDLWQQETTARIENDRQAELQRLETRLDALVAEIRASVKDQLRTLGGESKRKFDRALDRVRNSAAREMRQAVSTGGQTAPSDASIPEAGSRVRIHSMGVEGVVLQVLERTAEIAVGHMKVQRPFLDIEPLEKAEIRLPGNVSLHMMTDKTMESNEINLIGCRSDEAVARLDKFLDDAFLGQLPSVRIIHGSGTGALRRSIGEFLESHPHVRGFQFASPADGGRGVTIASLEE